MLVADSVCVCVCVHVCLMSSNLIIKVRTLWLLTERPMGMLIKGQSALIIFCMSTGRLRD